MDKVHAEYFELLLRGSQSGVPYFWNNRSLSSDDPDSCLHETKLQKLNTVKWVLKKDINRLFGKCPEA